MTRTAKTAPANRAGWRLLGKDGRFNVASIGRGSHGLSDMYHRTLGLSWPVFFIYVFGVYFLTNLIFAAGYFLAGPEALQGTSPAKDVVHFGECLAFSIQTLSTIGYGRIHPQGFWANALVGLEALTGLLLFGLLTGLLFARFSRPTAKVVFSRQALIGRENGCPLLVFRMANQRLNQIVEANVSVTFVRTEMTAEGEQYRRIYDLKLERNHSPIFVMTWTVTHRMDETSPLYGLSREAMQAAGAELIVALTGLDDTFNQTIHARTSYNADDVIWEHRFADMLSFEAGKVVVDIGRIHDVLPLGAGPDLPKKNV